MGVDLIEVTISAVVCIIVLADGFLKFSTWEHYRQSLHYFLVGFLVLLTVGTFNSLAVGRWDLDYIISFLSLKKVGLWMFRILAMYSYIYFAKGIEVLIIVKTKKIKHVKNV